MQEHITLLAGIPSLTCNDKLYNETLLKDFDWLKKTIEFTKSFSDYLHYIKTSPGFIEPDDIPMEDVDSYSIKIKQNAPFLIYKETCKNNYRRILAIMKNLYKTAMNIPDVDTVIQTIEKDFQMSTHIYLKNPEFIFDHYIYHVYSYNHIVDSFSTALTVLNIFEYLFYKITNYGAELTYDSLRQSDV